MGTHSFKSSGTTAAANAANALPTTPVPIGIATPLALNTSGKDGLLQMNYTLAAQMQDNLRNLILTNWGERLGKYNFGANLRPLMTELVSQDDFDTQAISRIRTAVAAWMPYIDLEDFTSSTQRQSNQQTAVILLTITYNIPGLSVIGKKIQVALYAI
jgi:phage baseplate assembly protein W